MFVWCSCKRRDIQLLQVHSDFCDPVQQSHSHQSHRHSGGKALGGQLYQDLAPVYDAR